MKKQLLITITHSTRSVICALAFLLCFIKISFAQPPTVKTSVDKNNLLIGQQLKYRVEASMPDNTYRLSWFNFSDSLDHFVVVEKNKVDSSTANGNLNFSQVITLTNFDSGRRVIPPLALTFTTLEGDSTFNIYTDSIPVNISYSPIDSTQPFHDIKTIIEVKSEWPWWIWALIGLGIIILIFCIVFLVKYLKRKKTTNSLFTSALPPYDEAMQALANLEREQLIQKNEIKEYHLKLTEIFKRYLSRKTNTYQLHLTSDELLMEISRFNLAKQQISDFANALRMGNAVKFAQYIPPVHENETCFSQTKEMINSIEATINKKTESDL